MSSSLCRGSFVLLLGALLVGGCSQSPTPAPQPQTSPAPATGQAPTPAPVDGSSQDAAAAVAVITDYYAAIDARDYQRAFDQWGDSGRASGKSFEGFAAGFRQTKHVEVVPGVPSRVDPAAGSRYITVPVVVTARTADDQEQRYEGTYDLRRTVVDGATEAQRRWHLESAALTQTK